MSFECPNCGKIGIKEDAKSIDPVCTKCALRNKLQRRNLANHQMSLVFPALLGFTFIVVVLFFIGPKELPPSEQRLKDIDFENRDRIYAAKESAKRHLLKPSTARFSSVYVSESGDKKTKVVCGKMQGENAFGAPGEIVRFIHLFEANVSFLSTSDETFNTAWDNNCLHRIGSYHY